MAAATLVGLLAFGSKPCAYDFEILEVGSHLDLRGDINGHPLSLKHEDHHPYPSGIFAITLSKCPPKHQADLVDLESFEYTFESKGTISVHPITGIEVKAGPATLMVTGLKVGLNGTQVVRVAGNEFETVLDMEIRSGVGAAMGHAYDLAGCTAKVPMKGYFAYDGRSRDLTFHIYEFKAPFVVNPVDGIAGQFTASGALTAIHLGAGVGTGRWAAYPAHLAAAGARALAGPSQRSPLCWLALAVCLVAVALAVRLGGYARQPRLW